MRLFMFIAVTASRIAGSYRIPSQNRHSSGISSTLVRLARGRSVDIDDIDDTVTQDGPREYHVPVLLNECCEYLVIKENGIYVDCTIGGGGHTREILRRGGRVIGLDQDPDAIAKTSADLISYIESGHLEIIQTNFRYIERAIKSSKFADGMNVDGVLMDLGISSHQIDEPSRGFAFGADGPLDMRMGQGKSIYSKLSIDISARRLDLEKCGRFPCKLFLPPSNSRPYDYPRGLGSGYRTSEYVRRAYN